MSAARDDWETVRVGEARFDVEAGRSAKGRNCSCGMPIPVGGPMIHVVRFPPIAASLFRDSEFHGPACLNAYLLVGLALLVAVDQPSAQTVCRDLRDLVESLRGARAQFAQAGFI